MNNQEKLSSLWLENSSHAVKIMLEYMQESIDPLSYANAVLHTFGFCDEYDLNIAKNKAIMLIRECINKKV